MGVCVNSDSTYAVVDIETTGTNPKIDRIIQIGCVLIERGKIVARFATDVNPGIKISKQIESLTGIKNSQVAKAPYFEDVAFTIHQLLSDCVFVAHNIYFDYNFLNHELKRCGVGELKIQGIDTVELAQIFLPTASSFRLSDLAEDLQLSHDRPHQADSDAEVTAELLMKITEKMKELPLTTVEKIVELSDLLGMDTGAYIRSVYDTMKTKVSPLDQHLEIIQGIALQKKEVPLFSSPQYEQSPYPKTKVAKEKLFNDALTYRPTQAKMMNIVADFFSQTEESSKNQAIEVATGIGKTLGYLFPLSYVATPANPVIISTVSIVLESQILEKDLPLLNRLSPRKAQGVLVKSHRHFLNLDSFVATLKKPLKQKQYALFQMRILVWLTQTITGDLDELQLTSFNHVFWNEVRHRGLEYVPKSSTFYPVDFLLHLENKMKQANFIIVNHAFLCQEDLRETPLLPASPYLVIDEAHHFPEIAQRSGTQRVLGSELNHLAIQAQDEESDYAKAEKIIYNEKSWIQKNRLLKMIIAESAETYQEIMEDFLLEWPAASQKTQEEILISKEWLENRPLGFKKDVRQLLSLLSEGQQIQAEFRQDLIVGIDKWTASERVVLTQWLGNLELLGRLASFFQVFFHEESPSLVKWVAFHEKKQQLTFYYQNFEAALIPTKKWYTRYQKILYTGGTLQVGKDKQFLARELGLSEMPFKVLADPYNYQTQARLFVPTDGPDIRSSSSQGYARYLADVICKLADQQNRPILVLFTSHELLQQVYHQTHLKLLSSGREVLAQGISGSREKITKRFTLSPNSLLFGADSFWEGVDLPGDTLELIVITRLPFESPERPFVKAKYQYLESKGINAFYQEAVPKAGMRLRQGFGRLIRSEQDRGVMIVLDQRIVKAKYGKKLLRALPPELAVQNQSLDEIFSEIKDFLKNQEK